MTIRKSGEDYLEAVLIIKNRKTYVKSMDVADYLGVSKPSVSAAVKNLQEAGMIVMEDGKFLDLTPAGRAIAEHIYEKHRLLTEILVKTGVSREQAEIDACEMEHVISDESFERLKEYFGT